LRGVRFPSPQAFTYLNSSADTGTAADDAIAPGISSNDAQFFRFSQSAQETYKAETGMAAGADTTSAARTELFRQGMRTLDGAKVAALAAKIAELVALKQSSEASFGGPFRSLQEFLSPSPLFAATDADGNVGSGRSLLEAAIADTGINVDAAGNPIEFSSQFLTQADIMTALAPVLFARSDTFIIRAYGEAVNPATAGVEGRAWCEAVVQRFPEYFSDPANNPADAALSSFDAPSNIDDATSAPTLEHQLNKLYGRRFKVVSFRWLTRSDI
jgi:hypothetical protein